MLKKILLIPNHNFITLKGRNLCNISVHSSLYVATICLQQTLCQVPSGAYTWANLI